jgi:hypothetical protein
MKITFRKHLFLFLLMLNMSLISDISFAQRRDLSQRKITISEIAINGIPLPNTKDIVI